MPLKPLKFSRTSGFRAMRETVIQLALRMNVLAEMTTQQNDDGVSQFNFSETRAVLDLPDAQALISRINNLDQSITELVESCEAEKAELEAEVAALEVEVASLESQLSAAQDEIADFEQPGTVTFSYYDEGSGAGFISGTITLTPIDIISSPPTWNARIICAYYKGGYSTIQDRIFVTKLSTVLLSSGYQTVNTGDIVVFDFSGNFTTTLNKNDAIKVEAAGLNAFGQNIYYSGAGEWRMFLWP